jgi:uncharacterized protein (DUF58 family)
MSVLRLDLLDPFEAAKLGGIELVARGVVEGFLSGLHRSPYHGFSVEFAEHRPYQAGDELRYLDWKALGRRDRLYVKQFEEETNLRATLVLDISRSMGWAGRSDRLTKCAYAVRLAAALGLILLRQRDATGLIAFDDEVRVRLPPKARSGQWQLLAGTLQGLQPGGGTAADVALRRVTELLRRRGMVLFVSDLLLDRDLALNALRFLHHRGHSVIVLHVMDPSELDLEPGGEARFVDPETGESVVAAPRDLRADYRATVERVVRAWRRDCRSTGIGYHQITTTTPFGEALRRASEEGDPRGTQ